MQRQVNCEGGVTQNGSVTVAVWLAEPHQTSVTLKFKIMKMKIMKGFHTKKCII